MKKINVVLLSTFCLGLTFYGILSASYYQQFIVSSSNGLILLRFVICASLLLYVLRPQVRTYFAQKLMGAGGWTLLLFSIATFVSPGLFGHSVSYVPIADTFIMVEGAILALLLSLELPAQEPAVKTQKSLQYFTNLLVATKPEKVIRTAARASTR